MEAMTLQRQSLLEGLTNLDQTNKFTQSFLAKKLQKIKKKASVLGPVNHGYSQTYKGQLHMMSQAISNNLAVSKTKLS